MNDALLDPPLVLLRTANYNYVCLKFRTCISGDFESSPTELGACEIRTIE